MQRKIIFTEWIRNAPGRMMDVSPAGIFLNHFFPRAKGNVELKNSKCDWLVMQGIP